MTDSKFYRDYDRQVVLLDFKQRIIDMMENTQELPEVGIYDEPVKYFKANEEWCKIIFGWLDWLEDVAGWKDAEDDNYAGIQQILIFEEGIDMATKEDIRDGMYEAMNRLAAQIVSGRFTNIAVGEDGTVSNPEDTLSNEPLPEDDPLTAINENKAARYGAALAISAGVNEFLAYLNTLYGADATADTSIANATILVNGKYVTETNMGAELTVYWDARAQSQAQITTLDREDLANAIYCNPYLDAKASISQFIYGLVAFTVEQKRNAANLITALEETQYSAWHNTGRAAPSTEYAEAPCEPSPTEIITILLVSTNYTSNTSWKPNHRLRFTVTGYLHDTADGNQRDFWWYHGGAPLSPVFVQASTSMSIGTGIIKPTVNQVPYNAQGAYVFTIDTPASAGQLGMNLAAGGAWGGTVGGSITVTIDDLGKIV